MLELASQLQVMNKLKQREDAGYDDGKYQTTLNELYVILTNPLSSYIESRQVLLCSVVAVSAFNDLNKRNRAYQVAVNCWDTFCHSHLGPGRLQPLEEGRALFILAQQLLEGPDTTDKQVGSRMEVFPKLVDEMLSVRGRDRDLLTVAVAVFTHFQSLSRGPDTTVATIGDEAATRIKRYAKSGALSMEDAMKDTVKYIRQTPLERTKLEDALKEQPSRGIFWG